MPQQAQAGVPFRSFNAGEWATTLWGRTDNDRYPASTRRTYNAIAAPQGPALRRSGSAFVNNRISHEVDSVPLAFTYDNTQAKVLELGDGRVRFLDELGLQTLADPLPCWIIRTSPLAVSAWSFSATVGQTVVLSGVNPAYNLNGVPLEITAHDGAEYTLDASIDVIAGNTDFGNPGVAIVFEVDMPYTDAQAADLRGTQSLDRLYLFGETKRPYTLNRNGLTDWEFVPVNLIDGPYMEPNDTGINLVLDDTGNMAQTGLGTATGGTNPADAIDDDAETYWEGTVAQVGTLTYTPTVAFAATGYAIHAARANTNTSFQALDYAPATWTFEGYDGTDWIVLDSKRNHVLYDNYRSPYFKINNTTVYQAYKVDVTRCGRNGAIFPRIARLVIGSPDAAIAGFTASGTDGVNGGRGFLDTDVGRLIRIKGSDEYWRSYEITEVDSPTTFLAKLQTDPLPNLDAVHDWRLSYWSDTTGWPSVGLFMDDRLFMLGSTDAPDLIVGSFVGDYASMQQTDPLGEVANDNAVVFRLNARKRAKIMWASNDDRGLQIGTSTGEWTIGAANLNEALNASNVRAREPSARGSAAVEGVKIDKQVLYMQRGNRTVREFAYAYDIDGYKSLNMSLFAAHLSQSRYKEMDYAAEPYSIVWLLREDGTVVGLTYNKDENVTGYHQHDYGCVVEHQVVIPALDNSQDTLWLFCKRTIEPAQTVSADTLDELDAGNGDTFDTGDGSSLGWGEDAVLGFDDIELGFGQQTVRYIERLTPFWDFGNTIDKAFYVDCGIKYVGDPISVVYGLAHLEGKTVVGIADGVPITPRVVVNGSVALDLAARNIVIGLPFDTFIETNDPIMASVDAAGQLHAKRPKNVAISLWDTYGGKVGRFSNQTRTVEYVDIPYDEDSDEIQLPSLRTEIVGPFALTPGYDKKATLVLYQPGENPYPFNVIALVPDLEVAT